MVAASPAAIDLGARRGMPRRAAESLVPGALVLERDHVDEARRFEPVVRVVEARVPRVEILEPGLALVAIDGAVRYHGGESALLGLLRDELDAVAPGARLGVAAGPFAARVAATDAKANEGAPAVVVDDDVAFLSGRDLSALGARDMVATFRWLGLATLGDLAALPREAIASRFGSPGVTAHRLASGEAPVLAPRLIPTDLEVAAEFEEPLETLAQVDAVARSLGGRLMAGLRSHGVAPRVVEVVAEGAGGAGRSRRWRRVDPFDADAIVERVAWQLRTWIESDGGVPGGIVALRLTPHEISGDGRQLGFFTDTAAILEAERTLTHLQGLLGPERVVTARPQGGRDPADRVRWATWGEEPPAPERDPDAPWPGRTPGPAPALVPPEPVPFTIEWDGGIPTRVRLRSRWVEVVSWAGPWRRTGRWWQQEPSVDRYQVVTTAGAFLCEVADGGRTFLVGVYD